MQSQPHATPRRAFNYTRTAAGLWIMLLVTQGIWYGWLHPAQPSALPMLLVSMVPLLIPALFLRRPIRALLLVSMIALWYFTHAIMVLWSDPQVRMLALVEGVISLFLICLSLPLTKKRAASRRG